MEAEADASENFAGRTNLATLASPLTIREDSNYVPGRATSAFTRPEA